MLTVLQVAYSLAPVRQDVSGGAEQVLAMLDEALAASDCQSIVVATEDSRVNGTLVATPRPEPPFDAASLAQAQANHRAAIAEALHRFPVNVIHMHGQDFREYLPPAGVPVLVTLHVPREWYGPGPFTIDRPDTVLNFVSEAQRRLWPQSLPVLGVVPNGVRVEHFETRSRKRGFALALGRISPEKGFDLALAAAELAGVPLLLAGEVYPYPEHERYFRDRIAPQLGPSRGRYLGAVGFGPKRRLLAAARCVLLPSQTEETSSLVAMEALASGTPVIAYPSGALAEIVEHGVTGFLVKSTGEMALAINAAQQIDPEACRRAARLHFDAARTIEGYFDLYSRLAGSRVRAAS